MKDTVLVPAVPVPLPPHQPDCILHSFAVAKRTTRIDALNRELEGEMTLVQSSSPPVVYHLSFVSVICQVNSIFVSQSIVSLFYFRKLW
jgi:hypothetical protein